MRTKQCTSCKQIKSIKDFYRRRDFLLKLKYTSWCKGCTNKKSRIEYKNLSADQKKDLLVRLEKSRQKRKNSNPRLFKIKTRKARKLRYHKDPSRTLERNLQWRKENREYEKQRLRKWRKEHPIKAKRISRFSGSKRRALVLHAAPPWVDWKEIRRFYDKAPRGMQVDHIYPLQGQNSCGLHVRWNLQYLSAYDNRSKYNKLPVNK